MIEDFSDLSHKAQLLGSFTTGFLSVLTPCVYPLIPITLSVCGATKAQSRFDSFRVAFAYFLGIVITYTAVGVVSAHAGIMFGSFLGNDLVVWVMSGFLLVLALHSLELFQFTVFSSLQQIGNKIGGGGFFGSLCMGAASGLIAAPCIGPLLAGVLVIAASSEDAMWGGALLFSYAVGLGLPFLILGTFSSLLQQLPKSGRWLTWIKGITAVFLILVIFYLHAPRLNSLLHDTHLSTLPLALGALLAFGIIFMKFGYAYSQRTSRLFGSVLIALPLYSFFLYQPPEHTFENVEVRYQWNPKIEDALTEAKDRNTIVMVDLYAAWCAACKEYDTKTFSNSQVQAELQKLALSRVDFTESDEYNFSVAKKFNVQGLPCILFLTPDGNEIPDSRIMGFLDPKEFLSHLEQVTP